MSRTYPRISRRDALRLAGGTAASLASPGIITQVSAQGLDKLSYQTNWRAQAEHGGDSARRYLESGSGDTAALLGTIEKTAREFGWGVWRFGARDAARLTLEVTDSPFAAGYGAADTEVCAPITGMLQAVASLALGGVCEAREIACCARGAASCRFEALLRTKG